MSRPNTERRIRLEIDLLIIIASIVGAVWLVQSGAANELLRATRSIQFLDSLVSGIFFTSAFTTAPAIVILGEIARTDSVLGVAFFGGLGALLGDLLIFRFVKDRFSEDLMGLVGKKGRERFRHIIRTKLFRRFSPFVAALVFASPLPDEIAIMMLGFARTRTALFMLFSFTANFLGVLAVSLAARAIG